MSVKKEFGSVQAPVTLFRGAVENPWFEVYYKAALVPGAETVRVETHENLSIRGVMLHVEIYNPAGRFPVIVTPGGLGDCDGFRGFAQNLAAASSELQVIIYDRRNMGRSEVLFGTEPLAIEEAEDLHVLIQRLGVGPATLYGMSSGARSNLILADRYPEDVAALVIAPLTGGSFAAESLSEQYYLKYMKEPTTTMEEVAKTPFWSAYLARNPPDRQKDFLRLKVAEFLATMKRAGEHLLSFKDQTALGLTDAQLKGLRVPATLVLHHGDETDKLHPIPNSHAAVALIPNHATFGTAPTFADISGMLLPFVHKHATAAALGGAPRAKL